jgi:S-adenosylmethionine:tRNA ribosyltransferase-isomerase
LLLERFLTNAACGWHRQCEKETAGGQPIRFDENMTARVMGDLGGGRFGLEFHHSGDFNEQLEALGELPLPLYHSNSAYGNLDWERYQTVYAASSGAIAAPTADFILLPRCSRRCKQEESTELY